MFPKIVLVKKVGQIGLALPRLAAYLDEGNEMRVQTRELLAAHFDGHSAIFLDHHFFGEMAMIQLKHSPL